MKYWRDCEQCNGKGYSKQQPLDVTGVNGTIVTATMTYSCPHCVNGKVDASAEIQALLDAQAARIERLEGKLQAILDTMPPKVTTPLVIEIKEIAQEALKEAE